jgi:hypothetical protein
MREKEKTQLHKDFELWASHQKELNGLTTKWYIEQYDHPKMAIAFIAFKAATALQAERVRELEEALRKLSFAAQTTGGTTGPDDTLIQEINRASVTISDTGAL